MHGLLGTPGWNGAAPATDRAANGAPDGVLLPGQDLVEAARYLVPIEARLAQGCMVAAGIPAVLADDQLVQANLLWAPALGGVRILVPTPWLAQALEVLAALAHGDFMLDDDADVGAG